MAAAETLGRPVASGEELGLEEVQTKAGDQDRWMEWIQWMCPDGWSEAKKGKVNDNLWGVLY